jgi:hypothetical protein
MIDVGLKKACIMMDSNFLAYVEIINLLIMNNVTMILKDVIIIAKFDLFLNAVLNIKDASILII